jgi:hypothetical protein
MSMTTLQGEVSSGDTSWVGGLLGVFIVIG